MMILDIPVIGILRGVDSSLFSGIMDASFKAGLQAMEITMNTPGAADILAENRNNVPDGKYLGMGTIRNIREAEIAADRGAMFFVTPNVDTSVIEFAVSKHIPVIAGALTPTEVYAAWAAGATMIKVFPCNGFGPGYIKDLHGPFDDIPLVAVGGVTISNVNDYLKAGAIAVGVGNSLFGENAMKQRRMDDVGKNVTE
jgi:2-dehydro-3-deoxyphosphogluconate aldolase/(4S)-4-hydroxy-2-oxoglutarate aldolase